MGLGFRLQALGSGLGGLGVSRWNRVANMGCYAQLFITNAVLQERISDVGIWIYRARLDKRLDMHKYAPYQPFWLLRRRHARYQKLEPVEKEWCSLRGTWRVQERGLRVLCNPFLVRQSAPLESLRIGGPPEYYGGGGGGHLTLGGIDDGLRPKRPAANCLHKNLKTVGSLLRANRFRSHSCWGCG